MAQPPEVTYSGGWALRGAPPKRLSSRPARSYTGFTNKSGMTVVAGGSRLQR
ncbi:MAG: hypothetical protein IJK75_01240 [Bacteroidales bacterium]|nr:hypothetical protein [Bacteroidales bacterium]